MQLRVTDGTNTVDLSGSTAGISGCTYFPLGPSASESSVAEQAELVCKGTTAANIRSALNSVERLCEAAAHRRASGKGTRIFVEYKPIDSDSLYRSELYGGRLVYSEEPGARRFGETNPAIKVAFVFERAPWWEGPEVELQLSAQGQAAATGGRTITNNGTDNWVLVAAAQVTGTEPGPVRIQLKNNTGVSKWWRNHYVGINAFASPSNFGGVHQGETGSGDVASATCSNGYYHPYAVATTESYQALWTLTAAQMLSGGRWCRLLARFQSYIPSALVRARPVILEPNGLQTIWQGSQIWLPSTGVVEMVDLGSVPIPPGAYSDEYAQCMLGIRWQASTSTTVNLDYVQLVPMDGYRHAEQSGYSVPNNGAMEINEMDESVYYWSGSQRWPIYVMNGNGLKLWPNTLQQIRILHDGAGDSDVASTMSVRVWHRPRRAII